MIAITNAKVAGLDGPRWAPFRGFSLLFDNPGDGVSPMGKDLARLNFPVDTSPDLHLYRSFVVCLDRIGRDSLIDNYLFCPLPPCTYHVTVWDGLNDGNVELVFPGYRPDLESFLEALPDSLLTDREFTGEVDDSPLVLRTDWTIKFKFSKLAKWGNRVLVARLEPADRESEDEFGRIIANRNDLSVRFQEHFGFKITDYSPHVSLGYFANKEYAELATPQIDRWTGLCEKEAGDLTVAFGSISLYGFTDMATFFKAGQSASRVV
jgi:hypothetical protein